MNIFSLLESIVGLTLQSVKKTLEELLQALIQSPYNTKHYYPVILEGLSQYQIDVEYARKCLEANKHNHITATYYLLLKKHLRGGGESIADPRSPKYDPKYFFRRQPGFAKLNTHLIGEHTLSDQTGIQSQANRTRVGGSQPPIAPTRLRRIADGLIDMERYTPSQSTSYNFQLLNQAQRSRRRADSTTPHTSMGGGNYQTVTNSGRCPQYQQFLNQDGSLEYVMGSPSTVAGATATSGSAEMIITSSNLGDLHADRDRSPSMSPVTIRVNPNENSGGAQYRKRARRKANNTVISNSYFYPSQQQQSQAYQMSKTPVSLMTSMTPLDQITYTERPRQHQIPSSLNTLEQLMSEQAKRGHSKMSHQRNHAAHSMHTNPLNSNFGHFREEPANQQYRRKNPSHLSMQMNGPVAPTQMFNIDNSTTNSRFNVTYILTVTCSNFQSIVSLQPHQEMMQHLNKAMFIELQFIHIFTNHYQPPNFDMNQTILPNDLRQRRPGQQQQPMSQDQNCIGVSRVTQSSLNRLGIYLPQQYLPPQATTPSVLNQTINIISPKAYQNAQSQLKQQISSAVRSRRYKKDSGNKNLSPKGSNHTRNLVNIYKYTPVGPMPQRSSRQQIDYQQPQMQPNYISSQMATIPYSMNDSGAPYIGYAPSMSQPEQYVARHRPVKTSIGMAATSDPSKQPNIFYDQPIMQNMASLQLQQQQPSFGGQLSNDFVTRVQNQAQWPQRPASTIVPPSGIQNSVQYTHYTLIVGCLVIVYQGSIDSMEIPMNQDREVFRAYKQAITIYNIKNSVPSQQNAPIKGKRS